MKVFPGQHELCADIQWVVEDLLRSIYDRVGQKKRSVLPAWTDDNDDHDD